MEDDGESEAVPTTEEENVTSEEIEETEEESETRSEKTTKKRAKRSRFIDTEAGVSEDEDDEGSEGLDEATTRGRPRRRKIRGDSEEEEDEGDDEDDDFVDHEIEEKDRAFTEAFKKRLDAHAARREAARKAFEEEALDPEAVEQRLRQLYGRGRELPEGGDEQMTAATLSSLLQPQPDDPKLWLVKCRPGSERRAVAAMLRGLAAIGDNVGIFSVVGRDSLKGFIYVEAHKATDVMNAVQRTRLNHMIFASPINRPLMVPVGEMADALAMATVASTTTASGSAIESLEDEVAALREDDWVRVKRGKYAGDLAQVVSIDQDTRGETIDYIIRVKLLPRLSYSTTTGRGSNLGRQPRPLPRPFDPHEASQYGQVTKVRGFWLFNGEAYKEGFLFKDVRATSLQLANVSPRPEELDRFGKERPDGEILSEGEEAETFGEESVHEKIRFAKGEEVAIIKGEFQNLRGIVESTNVSTVEGDNYDDSTAIVMVGLEDKKTFPEPVAIPAKFLMRHFEIGDLVRVQGPGEHIGKSGMIVSIEMEKDRRKAQASGRPPMAVIFSTTDQSQFQVPLSRLVASTGITQVAPLQKSASSKTTSSFDLYDLVAAPNDECEAGLVLRILEEEGMASVLDSNGTDRKIPLKHLQKLASSSFSTGRGSATATDSQVLRTGDRVQLVDENETLRPATLLHTHRTIGFLRTIDTGEFMVRPLTNLSRPSVLSGIGSKMMSNPPVNGPRGGTRHMIGKSVTINGAGPYKGYVGIVKEITDTIARIELHTDSRVVNVARERISIPGEKVTPSPADGRSRNWGDTRTPTWGSTMDTRTPTWGAAHGKTPAWGAAQGRTPAWGGAASGGTGGKTPVWGSVQGKTPAWGSTTSKTPAWGSGTSKTPAWGTSARTPAIGELGKNISTGVSANRNALPPWAIPEAEVILKGSMATGGGDGNTVKITAVLPGGRLQVDGINQPLNIHEVLPAIPAKKDIVKIIGEEGTSGTVIGLDGPDAVIRVDGTSDFRIVPISSLVKMARSLQ